MKQVNQDALLLLAAALWLALVIVAIGADEMLCVVGCM